MIINVIRFICLLVYATLLVRQIFTMFAKAIIILVAVIDKQRYSVDFKPDIIVITITSGVLILNYLQRLGYF